MPEVKIAESKLPIEISAKLSNETLVEQGATERQNGAPEQSARSAGFQLRIAINTTQISNGYQRVDVER